MSGYEWPSDDVLRAGVEARGVGWTAKELGVPETSLRNRLRARDLPTRKAPVKLEPSDALKKIADLL